MAATGVQSWRQAVLLKRTLIKMRIKLHLLEVEQELVLATLCW